MLASQKALGSTFYSRAKTGVFGYFDQVVWRVRNLCIARSLAFAHSNHTRVRSLASSRCGCWKTIELSFEIRSARHSLSLEMRSRTQSLNRERNPRFGFFHGFRSDRRTAVGLPPYPERCRGASWRGVRRWRRGGGGRFSFVSSLETDGWGDFFTKNSVKKRFDEVGRSRFITLLFKQP